MRRIALALLCTAVLAGLTSGAGAEPTRDVSLKLESRAAVQRALQKLEALQHEDGSWCGDPAITALVVTAMVGSGRQEFRPDSQTVSRALAYVRGFARPDGSVYGKFYPNYTTSLAAMALVEAGLPQDKELIRKANAFLLDLQADESEDLSADDPQYGGWGYEKDAEADGMHRADMSNTQLALEALHAMAAAQEEDRPGTAAGESHTRSELAYGKAIRYLERCQNPDGGFIYRPGESKAGRDADGNLRSYGGMTYAGLKSMIYAQVDRGDRRITAAFEWICRNWSVTENPGLGMQGVFYHYHTMTKALRAYGQDVIVDAKGVRHDWRKELVGQLLKVQRADGTWANENGRWMERIPELVTAYAVLSIGHATQEW